MLVFLSFILAALVALAAYKLRALDTSGAIAATITGGLVFGLGGLPWAALLLAFFISSSGLSKLFGKRKAGLSEKFSKGSRRDWAQVAANGGLGALLAVAHWVWPQTWWPWVAYVGCMAAVNADTWATELGVLNPTPPRLITTLRPVERGESGAISWLGSLAALSGAALIGLIATLFYPGAGLALLLAGGLGGLGGSFFDSLLGATVQAIFWCPQCQKETERHPRHLCGNPTTHHRGWRVMDNDLVNFLASLFGAVLAALVYLLAL
jgi:uncharacterized protein (TIGR00297 family)